NKVEMRTLVANRPVGSDWLIEDGLKEGERVITEGLQYVKPGAEVKVAEATNVKVENPDQATPNKKPQETKGKKPITKYFM
ncbi:efflux transporter periplasmic adaptor subunit, partial [Pseudomonas syringae pv. tagetis]